MDQVAFPVILAYQFANGSPYMVETHQASADFTFITAKTDQDRWEEKSSYSPATSRG